MYLKDLIFLLSPDQEPNVSLIKNGNLHTYFMIMKAMAEIHLNYQDGILKPSIYYKHKNI